MITPHEHPCYTCRGTGRLTVGSGRGQQLACPACSGTGDATRGHRPQVRP